MASRIINLLSRGTSLATDNLPSHFTGLSMFLSFSKLNPCCARNLAFTAYDLAAIDHRLDTDNLGLMYLKVPVAVARSFPASSHILASVKKIDAPPPTRLAWP